MLKILLIGDVCAKPGRESIRDVLPGLKKKENIDLVIANIDNLAHGFGATAETVQELMSYGVDYMTSGNHIWKNADYTEVLSGDYPVIRPANYPETVEGKGFAEIDMGKKGVVLLIHILGWVFMNERTITEPFIFTEKFFRHIDYDKYSAIIVDMHAEATSEKVSMGHFLDGRASAVIGTHTHVPTADYRILPKGTAYATDAGMCGPLDSTLWAKNDIILQQNMLPYRVRFEVEEEGERVFSAMMIESNSPRNAFKIKHFYIIR